MEPRYAGFLRDRMRTGRPARHTYFSDVQLVASIHHMLITRRARSVRTACEAIVNKGFVFIGRGRYWIVAPERKHGYFIKRFRLQSLHEGDIRSRYASTRQHAERLREHYSSALKCRYEQDDDFRRDCDFWTDYRIAREVEPKRAIDRATLSSALDATDELSIFSRTVRHHPYYLEPLPEARRQKLSGWRKLPFRIKH